MNKMLRISQISLYRMLITKNNLSQSCPKLLSSLFFNSVSAPLGPDPQLISHNFSCLATQLARRDYSTSPNGDLDVNKEVDTINLKFVEAREEIDMAMESKETTYFDEEAECARVAVKEVVDLFQGLLAKLPESEKKSLQRSMGLKIEQLKAELQQLND